MTTKAYELDYCYKFVVTETVNGIEYSFEYEFPKEIITGQTKTQYLQNCKANSEGLAQFEIDKLNPPEEIQL